jgi:hypothetical protein
LGIDAVGVGWVERSEPISQTEDDQLSSKPCSWRQLFLHGELGRAAIVSPDGARGFASRRLSIHANAASIHDRSHRCVARSPAHTIWTLKEGDADYAVRWRLIKSAFSRALPAGERISPSRFSKGERGIWQRRYWEHTLRNEADLERHFDYIHFNPVKHELVRRVQDWPYSSFHRMVRLGICPRDWGGDGGDGGGEFGER